MFIASVFIRGINWKQGRYVSVDEWLHNSGAFVP